MTRIYTYTNRTGEVFIYKKFEDTEGNIKWCVLDISGNWVKCIPMVTQIEMKQY